MKHLLKADQGQTAHSIHLVDKDGFADWRKAQPQRVRAILDAARFDGQSPFAHLILPGEAEDDWSVVTTVAKPAALSPWCLAKLGEVLPAGTYRLADDHDPGPAMLGWIIAQHRFDRFKSEVKEPAGPRILLTKEAGGIEAAERAAAATIMVREMVDTPAADMGPEALEQIAKELADKHHAKLEVTRGDALAQGYPMIQAVGQAAAKEHAPRLIELHWGREDAPRVAIIGKGVCFDSGGLDIKPASGMRLMKKDMGGAAHALALARMVMEARLPVRLHLLVPAVENAISGNAFRPGDIIKSRKGITVEIDNTDAEGRLVLGDALTKAMESEPGLILDFATLTGAARVALGPDLPALFSNDETLAASLLDGAKAVDDAVWRMPLWDGYDEMLKSTIADMANSAGSPFAGAITAALFLRRFVSADVPWAHFDTFAWRPNAKPGRPKGGDAYGLRCAFAALEARYPK